MILVVFCQGNSTVSSADTDPRTLLEQCLETQSHTNTIEYDGITDTAWSSFGQSRKNQARYRFQRDGDLLDVSYSDLIFKRGERTLMKHRLTYNGDYKMGYQHAHTKDLPTSGLLWHKDRDYERLRLLCGANRFGSPMDGYIGTGGKRLADYLLKAEDLHIVASETPNDSSSIAVRGTTEYGLVTLWISPDQGHIVNRASVRKGASDLLLLHLRVSDIQNDPRVESDNVVEWDADLSEVVAKQIDDVWIAVSGILTLTEKHPDGTKSSRSFTCRREHINLNPKFSPDAFQTDLPIGTYVNYIDKAESGVRYEWDGSKPVVSAR